MYYTTDGVNAMAVTGKMFAAIVLMCRLKANTARGVQDSRSIDTL